MIKRLCGKSVSDHTEIICNSLDVIQNGTTRWQDVFSHTPGPDDQTLFTMYSVIQEVSERTK